EAEPVIALDEEAGVRLDRTIGVELADAEQDDTAHDDKAKDQKSEQRARYLDQPAATAAPVLAVVCHSGSPSLGGEEHGGATAEVVSPACGRSATRWCRRIRRSLKGPRQWSACVPHAARDR